MKKSGCTILLHFEQVANLLLVRILKYSLGWLMAVWESLFMNSPHRLTRVRIRKPYRTLSYFQPQQLKSQRFGCRQWTNVFRRLLSPTWLQHGDNIINILARRVFFLLTSTRAHSHTHYMIIAINTTLSLHDHHHQYITLAASRIFCPVLVENKRRQRLLTDVDERQDDKMKLCIPRLQPSVFVICHRTASPQDETFDSHFGK